MKLPAEAVLRKLFASAFFMDAGFFLLVAALPYKVLDLGGGSLELGMMPTPSSLVYIVMTQLVGRWSDSFGRFRMSRYGALALIAFAALAFQADTYWKLLLLMPLFGFGASLFWPSIQAAIGDLSAGNAKALVHNTGRFNVAWGVGKALGYFSAGMLLAHYSFRATFLTAIGLIAASFLFTPKEEVSSEAVEPEAAPGTDPSRGDRFRKMAWLANFASFGASAVLANLLPEWFVNRGWPESRFGIFLGALFALQTAVFALLASRIRFADSVSRLLLPQLLAALAILSLPFLPGFFSLMLITPLIGFSFGVTYAASIYYSLHTESGKGKNAGIHESLIGASVFLFPLAGGMIVRLSGSLASPYLFMGSVMLMALALQWVWAVKKS
ncbi:MAG: MFS transporter [Candidatus Krumholzibacteria bacterium]|jgi:hypothetical protein|nr:MFS transporter [Candidatus Krumholzibacteria bacterium]MDP6668346.1 MFS transporter [Candidatus Krumholzibacteria bacterium]MDP6796385.1 MFS transporter [Candidatus Krumholzibacteria bacterium]MDP7022201.1 MFS transporter [Candidatus Krumholzibacteria bacterium]